MRHEEIKTHNAREDLPDALGRALGLWAPAVETVLEAEERLAHRIAEADPGAVDEGDCADAPALSRRRNAMSDHHEKKKKKNREGGKRHSETRTISVRAT
jgi:hypothetical protein